MHCLQHQWWHSSYRKHVAAEVAKVLVALPRFPADWGMRLPFNHKHREARVYV